MKPLNIYIHIPFCHGKCAYCAFYSTIPTEHLIQRYTKSLLYESQRTAAIYSDRLVNSVYFGGGTPSVLCEKQISDIVEALHKNFNMARNTEITLEANPESITSLKLSTYRTIGINRLSLGLQAWQDEILIRMNRLHDKDTFIKVYAQSRLAGFKNINVDLIFGYPMQTEEQWHKSLREVIKMKPEHVSCYSLETNNRAVLLKNLPSEESERSMYHTAQELLREAGYDQYEISNFSLPHYECQHNLNFWNHQDFLGLGAGAHSKIGNRHFHHLEDVNRYIQNPLKTQEDLEFNPEKSKLEWLILRLRLIRGVSTAEYLELFHTDIHDDFSLKLSQLISQGLLVKNNEYIYCSSKGLDLYDYVIEFLA